MVTSILAARSICAPPPPSPFLEDFCDWLRGGKKKKAQQLLSAHPPLIIGDSCEGLVSFLALSLGPGSGAARHTHLHAHTDGTRTMAATHGEYRGYLRNTVDMEAGQHRFHSVQSSESTYRPLLFGTLAVMGLLQVASSVAILLHLTGYLQEVGSQRRLFF